MFKLSFSKKLFIGSSITVILLLTLTIVGLRTTRQLQTANNWVIHTYEVIRLTHRVSENFQDAQTNQILYIITANGVNLTIFKKECDTIRKQISALNNLVKDNPSQLNRIKQLNNCLSVRVDELSRINNIRLKSGFQAAQVVMDANGLNTTYTCEDSIINDIINAEKSLLIKRKAISNIQVSQAIEIILISCFGAIIFLSGMVWLIKKTFKEKRLIREKLQLSESKFLRAFNDSATGMALVSIKGEWIDVNNYLVQLLGYSKEELFGTTFQAITHPDDIEQNLKVLKQAIKGEISKYHLEKRFIHKDGYPIWTLVNVSLVNDIEGIEPFFVSQIIDISATKKLIAEMELKNNVLTKTSNDLKLKIDQLEDFNSIVAHNLRGPAGTIQYILNMMIEEESESEKQSYMNMLVDISKSLNETLEDLMKVLEIKLNDQLHFDDCELSEIMDKISLELKGEILKSKATIKTNFGVSMVSFPRIYLESIFYNMISNSLKYRQKNTPAEVRISSCADAGKTMLVFEDNGLGIDLERHGKDIFKLNQVFHAGYDSKGVGLFMTKNQIVANGGSIQVESTPNQGTRFTVSLN